MKSTDPDLALDGDAPSVDRDDPGRRRNIVRRAYDWTIHWSETPYAQWALFFLTFAEASFFPIPPDVLLMAMAMAAPRRALRFSLICTAGSVVGGCLGYYIGVAGYETIGKPVIEFYGAQAAFDKLVTNFGERGFLYVFVAALTPIPYKVFTIAAGVCHQRVGLDVLIAASIAGRGLRFFAIGIGFRLFGARIKNFIDKYFNLLTIAFVVLLVLGFAMVKLVWKPGHTQTGPPEPAGGSEKVEPASQPN